MNPLKVNIRGMVLFCLICLVSAHLQAKPNDGDETDFNKGYNTFAFNLLKQISKEQPTQNVFISPLSVSIVLQMVSEGAAGKTKSEIQQTLQTANLSSVTLNATYKDLIHSLNSTTDAVVNLADGIWFQKGLHLKQDFIEEVQNSFQAKLEKVDFNKPAAAEKINDWAWKETHGKINGIVNFPFPDQIRVLLANAIYFKGKWWDPFDKSLTKPRDFYLSGGNLIKAPMMFKHHAFSYRETAQFQAVQLSYRGGMIMSLFLPATNTSPEQLLSEFSSQDWNDNLSGFFDREGTLAFPKFKYDYDVDLNHSLQLLGIEKAFNPEIADFSSMAEEQLFIGEVKQKSFVAADEEGTEAAAVTDAVIPAGGIYEIGEKPKPFEMIANRPFLFVISMYSKSLTKTILFMGIVNDPKTKD